MKTIIATAALAVALASPVMAQQYQTWEPGMQQPYAQSWQDPAQTFAFSPGDGRVLRPRSPNPAWDVYDTTGEYLGSDPDPRIRSQLMFDPPGRNGD